MGMVANGMGKVVDWSGRIDTYCSQMLEEFLLCGRSLLGAIHGVSELPIDTESNQDLVSLSGGCRYFYVVIG